VGTESSKQYGRIQSNGLFLETCYLKIENTEHV